MPEEPDWVSNRIAEARAKFPTVTGAAVDSLKEALAGQLSKNELTPAQLKSFAREVLKLNIPPANEPEARQ